VPAELEILTSIVRVFKEGESYGDPYEFSVTVRWITPKRVEILGAVRAPKPSEWRAIQECLHSYGAEELIIIKAKNGEMKKHIFLLDKTPAKNRRGHL
jgi:hypothetical protein